MLILSRSRIHERAISLRFLGIILRVISLEISVSVYNFYITKPVSNLFCSNPSVDVTVNSKYENS